MSGWQEYDPRRPQPQFQPYRQPQHAQPAPQPSQPQPAPRAKKATRRPLLGCLTIVAVAAVIGIVIAVATSGGSGGSFKATVENYTVINPADLAVAVHVTNTGSTAATPTCTVTAQDPSGAYSGFDEGTLTSPVQPGATTTYVDNVTISGQGAQYVTQANVTC